MTKSPEKKIVISFTLTLVFLLLLILYAMTAGSIKLSLGQLFNGLFVAYNPDVALVYDLRFPRIIVALLAGAALAVSGTMLQAVMRNPMTDPGIIGISSAASLIGLAFNIFLPQYYYLAPFVSIFGGLFAYLLIYTLAWDGGVRPVRLILVGVALNMTFLGIANAMMTLLGGKLTQTQAIIAGNVAQKTWADVRVLALYVGVFLLLAIFTIRTCNLLALEDKTARSLGVNVDRNRFFVALIAIILASITTAIVGVVGFIGLLVPHIGRMLVTSDHKYLFPYSIILGASILLLSDTVGRLIAYPFEVQATVIMSIIGGPFFIILLRAGGKDYGN